jgi:uncharacterized phage infection (PIP) family protein YhgE
MVLDSLPCPSDGSRRPRPNHAGRNASRHSAAVTGSAARSYNREGADKLPTNERLNIVSRPSNRSWDEMIDALRAAAAQVRSALGQAGSASAADDAAAARLKGDVSRLEQSASELISKISAGLRERRSEIDTSFDRERAKRTTEQMKSSLEELAALAGSVTADIASAANSTLKQSEPELKNVARALEDVAGSAASWIRTAIDPATEQSREQAGQNRPPLDDL